jgi:hypothetical protein
MVPQQSTAVNPLIGMMRQPKIYIRLPSGGNFWPEGSLVMPESGEFPVYSMTAKDGPAWPDFVEAINNGSIFSIVTARGHTPSVMRDAVYNLIVSNHNGIDSEELVRNLEKYRDLADEGELSKKELIQEYLDLCKFYPVTYGEGSATNPEEGKIKALKEFVDYVKNISNELQNKAFLKNRISNYFVPKIGFSDDDIKNVDIVKKHFS